MAGAPYPMATASHSHSISGAACRAGKPAVFGIHRGRGIAGSTGCGQVPTIEAAHLNV